MAIERLFSDKLENCSWSARAYCYGLGTPCDCNRGSTSSGQCSQYAYGYCCTVGTPCMCAVKDDSKDHLPEPEYQPMDPAERMAIERLFSDKLENCSSSAWAYCCGVGTPCDCTRGSTASGQCSQYAYGYCCTVGTPCMCAVADESEDHLPK